MTIPSALGLLRNIRTRHITDIRSFSQKESLNMRARGKTQKVQPHFYKKTRTSVFLCLDIAQDYSRFGIEIKHIYACMHLHARNE